MKAGYVYIMANRKNGTLYIGVTSDLVKRVWEHKNGVVPGFTKRYGCKLLVWYEAHEDLRARPRAANEGMEPRLEDPADRANESRLARSLPDAAVSGLAPALDPGLRRGTSFIEIPVGSANGGCLARNGR